MSDGPKQRASVTYEFKGENVWPWQIERRKAMSTYAQMAKWSTIEIAKCDDLAEVEKLVEEKFRELARSGLQQAVAIIRNSCGSNPICSGCNKNITAILDRDLLIMNKKVN